MPRSRLKEIEECYLSIALCPTVYYQSWSDSNNTYCLICDKQFSIEYLNSEDIEKICNKKRQKEVKVTKPTRMYEDKVFQNFYTFFYREVIDHICMPCKNAQNLLPSPEFYVKLDAGIKDRWGV